VPALDATKQRTSPNFPCGRECQESTDPTFAPPRSNLRDAQDVDAVSVRSDGRSAFPGQTRVNRPTSATLHLCWGEDCAELLMLRDRGIPDDEPKEGADFSSRWSMVFAQCQSDARPRPFLLELKRTERCIRDIARVDADFRRLANVVQPGYLMALGLAAVSA
jgi:hypothetical protein